MPYPQVSPPTDHGAFSPGQDDPLNRRTTTQRRRLLITGIISIALLLFVGQFSKANTGEATDALERAWHRMGAQQLELPPCEKTFLYSFSGNKGFGSELGIYARGALWARYHNSTLLVNNNDWVYGRYEDYFESPVLDCIPSDNAQLPKHKANVRVGDQGWQSAQQLWMTRSSHGPVDMWMMRDLLDVETLLALPDLDLSKPLPLGETITPAMESMFAEQSALFREIWQPVTKLKTWIEDVREQFGLQDELRPRGHVIGLHYRGGDKLWNECTAEHNCGNTTIYLQAAHAMLDRLPEPSCTSCKPTLALMTIEPDAQKLFERDSLAGAFDIKPLPPPQSGLKGHDQTEFNSWPIKERIDDTMTMLRDLTVLSLHADGFIVTGSSNVGVMAMMLGGPTGNVHSLDWRFQATSRPLDWYAAHGKDYRTEGQ